MNRYFLHGLGQTPASWDKTVKALGAPADCPDLRGLLNGKSALYSELYKALCGYLPADGEFDLCGLSLGGILALNYTADFPARVHSLVLIGAQYVTPKTLLKIQNAVFRFMPQSVFNSTGFNKPDFLMLANSMTELDFTDRLGGISCPTLVICGEKDRANMKAAENLARLIPNAELKTVPKSGHEVNIDAPEALAQLIKEFI